MLLLNVLLALAWAALTGQFTLTNLFFGFGLSAVLLWILQRAIYVQPDSPLAPTYLERLHRVAGLALFFIWEVFLASLRVTVDVLRPQPRIRPAVIAVPLEEHSDAELTLLATMITLTPGSLSLDISSNRDILYVHTMYLDDEETFRQHIRNDFARRVKEALA